MWFTETWIETLAADEVFSQELIGKKCEAKVQKRKNAFEKLLSGQYERLDQASSNGLQDIRDRSEFFDSLYRLETLKELQYPYLSRLESSLGSKKFQDTANHYLLTP